jgi:hypothetical protein
MTDQERPEEDVTLAAPMEEIRKWAMAVHHADGRMTYEPLLEHVVVGPDGVRRPKPVRQKIVVDVYDDEPSR